MAARRWTLEQRMEQSRRIRDWKPWEHSTGPVTKEGKLIDCDNPRTHGMCSRAVRYLRKLEIRFRKEGERDLALLDAVQQARWMVARYLALKDFGRKRLSGKKLLRVMRWVGRMEDRYIKAADPKYRARVARREKAYLQQERTA